MNSKPFPCQFRQNEIELCQDENQDRVNEFQFRFREKRFRQYGTDFANQVLCEIEFRYGGNEFRSCKIDSLSGKVELHVGYFQFCSGGIDYEYSLMSKLSM